MNHDEMIEVIQAHKEGKTIECRHKLDAGRPEMWRTCRVNPLWSFHDTDYRVKPEPRTRWVIEGNTSGGYKCLWIYTEKEKADASLAVVHEDPYNTYNVKSFSMYEVVERI